MKNVSTLDRKLQTLLPGSLSQYPRDRFENYFGAVEREKKDRGITCGGDVLDSPDLDRGYRKKKYTKTCKNRQRETEACLAFNNVSRQAYRQTIQTIQKKK